MEREITCTLNKIDVRDAVFEFVRRKYGYNAERIEGFCFLLGKELDKSSSVIEYSACFDGVLFKITLDK